MMSLFRSSIWAVASALLLTGSRFLFSAILTRRMSQDAFGQFAYGQWLVDISFLVCSLGATGAASRYAAEYKNRPVLLAAFFKRWLPFALGLPLLAALGVGVGVRPAGLPLTYSAVLSLSAWTFLNGVWAMQTASLIGVQRFDLIFKANALAAGIMLLGAACVPLSTCDVAMIFVFMSIASLLAAMVGLKRTFSLGRGKSQAFEPVQLRKMRGYALNVWIYSLLAGLVWSRGELPLVKHILSDRSAAQYVIALTLYGGAVQGMMLGMSGVAPHLTTLWGEDKHEELFALGRKVMDLQLAIGSLGGLLILCFSKEIVTIAFSESYEQAMVPLEVLSLGLLSFVTSAQSHILQIKSDSKFNRNLILLGVVALYLSSTILIPRLGLLGAAFARAGTLLLMSTITLFSVISHWGSQTVSLRNLSIVFLLFLFVWIFLHNVQLPISGRTCCCFVGFFLLYNLLKDKQGERVIGSLVFFLMGKLKVRFGYKGEGG